MINSIAAFCEPQYSFASSYAGSLIERRIKEAFRSTHNTSARQALLNDMYSAAYENMGINSGRTLQKALRFIERTPIYKIPSVSMDPDGDMGFDWYENGKVLSVSVNFMGKAFYSANFGGKPVTGKFSVDDTKISENFLELFNML